MREKAKEEREKEIKREKGKDREKRKKEKREEKKETSERKSVAFLLSASSRVCRHHGSSPESQKACYKRISQSITDHRSQDKRK